MGGFASDRLGTRPVLIGAPLIMASMFGLLLISRKRWVLFLFAALFAITYGKILCAMPPLPAGLVEQRHHSTFLGVITFASTPGGGLEPITAGFPIDVFREHIMAWVACLIASLSVSVLSLSTERTRGNEGRRPQEGAR